MGRNVQPAGCGRIAHAPGAHGRPAGLARRALVRHLLAAPARARRLRRQRDRRRRSRTSSSRSCSTSRPRTPRRTSSCTSTRPAASSTPAWRSTTRCASSSPTWRPICCGIAMSMGSLILAGGAAGKRSALPNSRILVHQPQRRLPGPGDRHPDPRQGGARAAAADRGDLRRAHRQAARGGVRRLERDRFFTPDQAREYGLIDRVCVYRSGTGTATATPRRLVLVVLRRATRAPARSPRRPTARSRGSRSR